MSSLFIRSMGCILCYNADNKSSMETYILNLAHDLLVGSRWYFYNNIIFSNV